MVTSKSALVVDDSRITRGLLVQILGLLGYGDVAQAPDGAEALALLATRSFDLVLTDWRMPRLDGENLIERASADARLREIPFVVISSVSDDEAVARLLRAGARHFIRKPFERSSVARVVGEVERVERLRREARPTLDGTIGGVSVVELVQLLQLTRRTGVLSIAPSGARLDFAAGEIAAARIGSRSGEGALPAILGIGTGSFRFDPAAARGPVTIERSTTALLVEALREADEQERASAPGSLS